MKAAHPSALMKEPTSERSEKLTALSRTSQELDFWIRCMGTALVVMESETLTARSANRGASLMFGMEIEEFVDCPAERLVGREAARMLGQIWSRDTPGIPGEPFLVRSIVQQQERLLMVQVTNLVVEHREVRLFTFTDAPPQGSVALAGWQENIFAILDWLPFGFEIASNDDQIQFVNSQFHELFGYSPHELQDVEDWWVLVYPDPDYRQFARTTWETSIASARAESREMKPFDLQVAIKDGSRRTIQFRHRTIGNFNINLYFDVTQERAYAQELKVLADTDPLTSVMNRRRFFEETNRFYAEGASQPGDMAVLMLDIDFFKRINDVHGHGIGDLVLKEFSHRCREAIRKEDLLARLGGEEFAILLVGTDFRQAIDIAEAVRSTINRVPFTVADKLLDVTVSIGAAMCFPDEEMIGPAMTRADNALYAAKNAGRDRVMMNSCGSTAR